MKKVVFVCTLIIVNILIINYYSHNYQNNAVSNQKITTNNALTMMLETDMDSNEYMVATSNEWPTDGYKFNEELSYCELGSTIIWNEDNKTISLKTNISDTCYIYFDVYQTAAMTITELFNQGTDELGNLDPDGNIRYTGSNPNNYVLFNNELWRIIGVFDDKLKIIRNNYIPVVFEDNGTIIGDTAVYEGGGIVFGTKDFFYWNYNGTNNWETATLKNYLNGTYYNSIDENSKNLIDIETWYLGGFDEFPTTASEFYETERSNNVYSGNPTTTNAYIGLLYPSDIFYSKSSSLLPENDIYLGDSNWISHMSGDGYWLISSSSIDNQYAITFLSTGGPFILHKNIINRQDSDYVKYGSPEVHPTLYLKKEVKITSGDGSSSNPYTLDIE